MADDTHLSLTLSVVVGVVSGTIAALVFSASPESAKAIALLVFVAVFGVTRLWHRKGAYRG